MQTKTVLYLYLYLSYNTYKILPRKYDKVVRLWNKGDATQQFLRLRKISQNKPSFTEQKYLYTETVPKLKMYIKS